MKNHPWAECDPLLSPIEVLFFQSNLVWGHGFCGIWSIYRAEKKLTSLTHQGLCQDESHQNDLHTRRRLVRGRQRVRDDFQKKCFVRSCFCCVSSFTLSLSSHVFCPSVYLKLCFSWSLCHDQLAHMSIMRPDLSFFYWAGLHLLSRSFTPAHPVSIPVILTQSVLKSYLPLVAYTIHIVLYCTDMPLCQSCWGLSIHFCFQFYFSLFFTEPIIFAIPCAQKKSFSIFRYFCAVTIKEPVYLLLGQIDPAWQSTAEESQFAVCDWLCIRHMVTVKVHWYVKITSVEHGRRFNTVS